MAQSEETKLNKRFDQNIEITGTIKLGVREQTTAGDYTSNKITLIPPYHTGGPFYIKTRDDANNAYLTVSYGASEVLKIKQDGTLSINGSDVLTSVPSEYLTQTEGDDRYLQTLPSHNHDTLYQPLNSLLSRFSNSSWAGTSGYPGYTFTGGNSRFGFSSTSGVVDMYIDGNYYATDSAHLVLHAGNIGSYALTSLPSHTHDYVPERGRSDWNDGTVVNNVIGQLTWKNYGNLHTIFDASSGTSPSGTSVNNSNSTYAWSATYPTLMGWNGSNTYGVRVDSSRVSDYATNAGSANLLDGIDSSQFLRSDTSDSMYGTLAIHTSQVWGDTTQGLTTGSLHLDPNSGTDHAGGAITWGASDASAGTNAQAGIYIRSDGGYGTRMYLSTTDSYATGSKTAIAIQQNGDVNIVRGNLYGAGSLVGVNIRSDYRYDYNGNFMWRVGTNAGTTTGRHLNLANTTIDPSDISISHQTTGITWGQRTDNNPYYIVRCRPTYNNGYSTHSRLDLSWHTGIEIGAASNYGGTRFFNNSSFVGSEIMRVGSGNNNVYINYTGEAGSDLRAPIFYDSNDTGYYLNPRSNSRLSGLRLDGVDNNASGDDAVLWVNKPNNNDWGIIVTGNLDYGLDLRMASSHTYGLRLTSGGSTSFLLNNDFARHESDMRAPVFYDNNNTNYYADPNSTSVMYAINDANSASYVSYKHSGSDFVSGTLVETDINASSQHGDSFVLDATGKSYSTDPPFMFTAQGYLYNYGIINYSGQHIGKPGFSSMKIFEYNGKLCFWWPRVSYWNSFEVRVRDAGGSSRNRVTNITNSTEPTGSKKVTVTMKYTPMYNYNYGTGNMYADRYYASNTNYYCDPDAWSRCYGFDSETRFAHNTYSDPDPGGARDAKFGDKGIAATYVHTSQQFTTFGSYKCYSWAGMVGDYDQNSTSEKIIWTIGDSWNSIGNMYGLGYTYGSGYDHHLSIKNNGTTYHRIGFGGNAYFTGAVQASASHRAPIFYDSNDTNYYVDPNSSTSAEFAGQIRFQRNDSRRIFGDVQNGNNSVRIAGNWDTFDILGRVIDWTGSNLHFGDGYNGQNHSSSYMIIGGNGNIDYLRVGGDGYFEGDVIAYYSDARLKQNVKPIDNALDIIKGIRGVTFEWNKTAEDIWKKKEGDEDFGLIAQEVEAVFPMGVVVQLGADRAKERGYADPESELYDPLHKPTNEEEQYKTVRYDKMVSVAIQAIKEQQETIESLQKQIDELKKLINP